MRITLFAAIVAAAFAAPLAGAGAAPQALGLVATDAPVPLVCSGGVCSAQLSAFCLQPARDMPAPGDAYAPAGDGLTLIAVTPTGEMRRLPGSNHLTVTAARGFTAVTVSLPERALADLGAARASVEVAARVSLLPLPWAGDPEPQTAEEIAVATGPYRATGERLVDDAGPAADAVRLTGAVINALPTRGRVGPETGDRVWRATVASRDAGVEAVDRAGEAYGTCRRRARQGFYYNIRRCLEQQHDRMLLDLNLRFWRALAGS